MTFADEEIGIALLRGTITAGAGETNADDVVAIERAAFLGAELNGLAVAQEKRLPPPSWLSPKQPIGGEAMTIAEQ